MATDIKADVLLFWKDFIVAAEELRHKEYNATLHNKDWFKLSPVEVFLLGCQSIGENGEAFGKVGSVTISISGIESHLLHQPRIFAWVMETLIDLLGSEECSLFMWQRCFGLLKTIVEYAGKESRFSLWLAAVITEKQKLLRQSPKSPVHRDQMDAFLGRFSSTEGVEQTIEKHLTKHFEEVEIAKLTNSPEYLQLERSLEGFCAKDLNCAKWLGFLKGLLLETILESSLQEENFDEKSDDVSNEVGSTYSKRNEIIKEINDVLVKLSTCVQFDHSQGLLLAILQNMAVHMSMAKQDLDDDTFTLNFVTTIFLDFVKEISSPKKELVLCHLYEFLTSADEIQLPRVQSLTSTLPNLLGTAFGMQDPEILADVLLYGSISFRSKHRKTLLGEGLFFINRVRQLFEPDDVLRQKMVSFHRRIEALLVASSTMAGFLDSVQLCCGQAEDANLIDEQDIVPKKDSETLGILRGIQFFGASSLDVETLLMSTQGLIDRLTSCKSDDVPLKMLVQALLRLACLLIQSGDNISYTYASVLPNLFYVTLFPDVTGIFPTSYFKDYPKPQGSILWHVDKKKFALKFLLLCQKCVTLGVGSPFHVCVALLPKLSKNIDKVDLTDEEKISLLTDYLDGCSEDGVSKEFLASMVSHGSDLISMLMPEYGKENIQKFLKKSAKLVSRLSGTTSLFLLKLSCEFLLTEFSARTAEVKNLLLMLLKKNNRDDIRCIYSVCQDWLKSQNLSFLVNVLLAYPNGNIKSRELQTVCEVWSYSKSNDAPAFLAVKLSGDTSFQMVVLQVRDKAGKDIDNPQLLTGCGCWSTVLSAVPYLSKLARTNVHLVLGLKKQLTTCACHAVKTPLAKAPSIPATDEKEEEGNMEYVGAVTVFIDAVLKEIEDSLKEEKTKDCHLKMKEKLSRISLFNILFHDDLVFQILRCRPNILEELDSSHFPADVRDNKNLTDILQSCAVRITNLQIPRYALMKTFLTSLLQQYLTIPLEGKCPDKCEDQEKPGLWQHGSETGNFHPTEEQGAVARSSLFEETVIAALEKNVTIRTELVACGYSPRIWQDCISVTVTTDGSLNTEENHRQTLMACFREYVGLLRQLGITTVEFDGKTIPVDDIFSDEFPLAELRGRRACVVREIDRRCGKSGSQIQQRKFALLAEEERLESELEYQSVRPMKPQVFKARLNVKFMDCASCCGPQIIGCYAPTGDHCERPLEIGVRNDSAIASIYDEAGTEIENTEVLFTEQGLYLFKAYSTGHPFDTSQVWIELFKEIVDRAAIVHAIILPFHFPNRHTWEKVRTFGSVELTGTLLSYNFDFSNDWRSYYDYRPESIRAGKDIVLQRGFFAGFENVSLRGFHRQLSFSSQKDIGGLIFDKCMDQLIQDEMLCNFRFLGKHIAGYINKVLENGYQDFILVSDQFDFMRWKKRQKLEEWSHISKDDIVQQLEKVVDFAFIDFLVKLDLDDFFITKRKQFFQLMDFASKIPSKGKYKQLGQMMSKKALQSIIKRNIVYRRIEDLPEGVQESFMHWVFSNEDRVWRYRGGLDECETLDSYLDLLPHRGPKNGPYSTFPGLLVSIRTEAFSVKDVIAYAVGQYVNHKEESDGKSHKEKLLPDSYEIITVWVDNKYRGLRIASELYTRILQSVKSPYFLFDILGGHHQNVIGGNPHFDKIFKFSSLLVKDHRSSYCVTTAVGEEQFERFVLRRAPLLFGLAVLTMVETWTRKGSYLGFAVLCCISVIVLVLGMLLV